ncbi:hypothetical protein V6N13_032858 [Hibiscus sabdariffa]|uniref:Uncharacterized protein n=1 Tax=Hibiscus sabdariffa TaxID=183260 RepID=A0ABR2FC72_9ROSI
MAFKPMHDISQALNPCVQTYFPTSKDKATSRRQGGPRPSHFGGQGLLKVARWSPPLIFPGPGHLKVARWSPQASATRLRTAARLEWLWPAPGLLEMARSVVSL